MADLRTTQRTDNHRLDFLPVGRAVDRHQAHVIIEIKDGKAIITKDNGSDVRILLITGEELQVIRRAPA